MPKVGQEVVVYAIGKGNGLSGERTYAICKRFTYRFSGSGVQERWSSPWRHFHLDYEITHWMPLKEPKRRKRKMEIQLWFIAIALFFVGFAIFCTK